MILFLALCFVGVAIGGATAPCSISPCSSRPMRWLTAGSLSA